MGIMGTGDENVDATGVVRMVGRSVVVHKGWRDGWMGCTVCTRSGLYAR